MEAALATDTAIQDASGRAAPPRLVRALGRFDLTAGVVNAVVGAGIFGAPAAVAALAGAWSPLAAVGAALGILTVVLCFAEVGSRFDESGGPYLYTREAFGTARGLRRRLAARLDAAAVGGRDPERVRATTSCRSCRGPEPPPGARR